jgi:cell division protein ZapA (FtsZ GTPase activity inhibitor)
MAALNFCHELCLEKEKTTNTLRPWTSGSRCCNAPSKPP